MSVNYLGQLVEFETGEFESCIEIKPVGALKFFLDFSVTSRPVQIELGKKLSLIC